MKRHKLHKWLTGILMLACSIHSYAGSDSTELRKEVEILRQEVKGLRARVERAEDYIAISNLQRIYGFYVDKARADQAADLFSAQATLEIAGRGVFVGEKRIREYMHRLPKLKEGLLFNHMSLQPVIHIAPDGNSAKGRWRSIIMVGILGKSATWGEGVYENEYVREDGLWKISKIHFYPTVYNDFYKGWDQPGIPLFSPYDNLPPDLPPSEVYESYPGIYIPPYHYDNPVSGRKYVPE